jgi:hypothetical protein
LDLAANISGVVALAKKPGLFEFSVPETMAARSVDFQV